MANQETILKSIDQFTQENNIRCITLVQDENGEDTEQYFSNSGCDFDPEGLGNNVYSMIATSKTEEEFEIEMSHEAYCLYLYGIE